MIKETVIAEGLYLIETDDYISIVVVDPYEGGTCRIEKRLDQIKAIHLRNNISIWANNKRNRDLRKEKK